MDSFFILLLNLLPLYGLIGLGFIGGRYFEIESKTMANLVIFIIVPMVMFGYVSQLKLNFAYIYLPVLYFCLLSFMAFLYYRIGKAIYPDSRANLLALTAAAHNSGYFGLPVMLIVFPQEWVAVYMVIVLGGIIFEATIGYYIAARGAFDVRQSLKKLSGYPALYAVPLGLLVNALTGGVLPEMVVTYWTYFKGAYVVMGMMIIGVALSKMKHFEFSLRFNALVYSGKLIVWPLLMGAVVALDTYVLGLYGPEVHLMLMLLSIMPPAANVTAFAAQFNTGPEKAATTVLAGTMLALLYIPLALWLIGH
jgi:predicted permease